MFCIWNKIKGRYYTHTISGLGKIQSVIICAEIGNINDFSHPDKIVAFAGLDPKVRKNMECTPVYQSKHRHNICRKRLMNCYKISDDV